MPDPRLGAFQSDEKAIGDSILSHGEQERLGQRGVVPNLRGEIQSVLTIKEGELNSKDWQNALDEAFLKGNFELIKIMQRVRPEAMPKAELVRTQLNELVETRPPGWNIMYLTVCSVSDQRPDASIVADEYSKMFTAVGNEESALDRLQIFRRATGYSPPSEEVQAKYRDLMKGKKLYKFTIEELFKGVRELTGTLPAQSLLQEVIENRGIMIAKELALRLGMEKISSEMIQRGYERNIEKYGSLDLQFTEIGEAPKAEIVQKAYLRVLQDQRNGWINCIQEIQYATGIVPEFSAEKVQPVLDEYISHGWLDRAKQIIEFTNVQPSAATLQKAIIPIIDQAIQNYNYGERLKEQVSQLPTISWPEIGPSWVEIQSRYRQAIESKKPHVITNLYEAFGIRPTINETAAQTFMLSCLGEVYDSSFKVLEQAFGVNCSPSPEEVEARYNELAKKCDLAGMEKIEKSIGIPPNRELTQLAVEHLFEQRVLAPPDTYYKWENEVKNKLEQYHITLSAEVVVQGYQRVIESEPIHQENIIKIHTLSGVPLPHGLAQKAYKRIISADYVSWRMKDNKTRMEYDRKSTFVGIHRASGIKPVFSQEELKAFSVSCLESEMYSRLPFLRTVTDICGMQLVFRDEEIQPLYKRWMLEGKPSKVETVAEFTGVPIKMDEELKGQVSQIIQARVTKAATKDYTDQRADKHTQTARLVDDLTVISELMKLTGEKPGEEDLQSLYGKILERDEFWDIRLDSMSKILGIAPRFSPEQIRSKAQPLIERAAVRDLEFLHRFGEYIFDPASVEKGYQAALDTNREKDPYNEGHRYVIGWIDRLQQFYTLTGISPNEKQSGEIMHHFLQGGRFSNRRRVTPIVEAVDILQQLGVRVTPHMVSDICGELLQSGDFNALEILREKVGGMLEFPSTAIQIRLNDCLLNDELAEMSEIESITGRFGILPFDVAKVQETYQRLISDKRFGGYASESSKLFFALNNISHISAVVSAEQASAIYQKTEVDNWGSLQKVLQVPPAPEDAQHKYFILLTSTYNFDKRDFDLVRSVGGSEISQQTAIRAMEYWAKQGEIKHIQSIVQKTGVAPLLSPDAIEAGYRALIKKKTSIYGLCKEGFDYFSDTCGMPPNKALLVELYKDLIDDTNYSNVTYGYHKFWDYLAQKFGKPDEAMTQQIYHSELMKGGWDSIRNLEYVQQFTGTAPDLKQMTISEAGTKTKIKERLRDILSEQLVKGDIESLEKLEKQFGTTLEISEADAQIMFVQILLQPADNKATMYESLVSRSHSLPNHEIVETCYRELFKQNDQAKLDKILELHTMVKVLPSEQLVQKEYEELFQVYVHRYATLYSDQYLDDIESLRQATGIEPRFTREFAMECYEFCINGHDSFHHKISEIARITGFNIDPAFIQAHILDNKEISYRLPVEISTHQLDQYFSNPENTTVAEYQRIYTIFGCFDYYQTVLAKLEQDQSLDAIRQRIGILGAMGLRDMGHDEQYQQIKRRLFACAEGQGKVVRKYLTEALAELALNGDSDLIAQLADTIRKRCRGELVDSQRSTAGFTHEEELALRTLMQLNNSTSNDALLSLLTAANIKEKVKKLVLQNLLNKYAFFPHHTREWLIEYSRMSPAFQWEDLKCFQAIRGIPSSDLRRKSTRHFDRSIAGFPHHGGIQVTHQEYAPSVPDNAFMQLWKFTGGDPELLRKFNELYEKTKSNTQRDAILFGIVNAAGVQKNVLQKVQACLRTIDILADPQALADLLKTISFLDTVQQRLRGNTYEQDEDYEGGEEESEYRKETTLLDALDQPFESVSMLNQALRRIVVESIKEVLPNDDIDADKIQTLWEQWGNLEPIFVYAGKMAGIKGVRRLVAEMVANMDPPTYEGWKKWRYNLENEVTQEQVGHLTTGQLERWKADHFAELGDIMIATSPTDRSKQVSSVLDGAVTEGHIFNAKMQGTSKKHELLQGRISVIYTACREKPDERTGIIDKALNSLQADMKGLEAVKYSMELSNPLDSFERIKAGKGKEKDVEFVAEAFLPEAERPRVIASMLALRQELGLSESQGGEKGASKKGIPGDVLRQRINDLLPETLSEIILRVPQKAQEKAVSSLSPALCERWGIDGSQFDMKSMKNIGTVHQKLKEMKTMLDLLRLSVLTPKLIATNRITEREDKKGESLAKVLENLRKFFKDTPAFIQDLDNIQSTIAHKEELGSNRRLAMIVTDNPQILFQVGKYPIGSGSCQNYEGDPGYNKSLAGYVSDAHTKAIFLIDLQKLPKDVLKEVEQKGFEATKDNIHPQDLLEASIARTMTKLVRAHGKETVLFLEPTYSSVNKGDLGMDKYFNIFAELMLSDPMGIRLVRGEGSERVSVPDSRNPSGQYEDCAAGNAGNAGMGIKQGPYTMSARFINKFSPVTDADRELAARISSES